MKSLSSPAVSGTHIATGRVLSRRSFLRNSGIALALPMLDSMFPAFARGAALAAATETARPRRMLAICNNIGLLPELFFPQQSGRGYTPSPYLGLLGAHRNDFTVFSGVSHPGVDGGHAADVSFLTAAPHPSNGGFRNSISLDQFVAERIGHHTRFPSLTLGVNVRRESRSLSWTGSGVLIPCEDRGSDVFRQLFVQGSPAEVEAQVQRLEQGMSILDTVSAQARSLQRRVGAHDRERLDQYFTSVRELEQQMQAGREWERRPKPVVTMAPPRDPASPREYMSKVKLMYDLSRLALETDSTRAITLLLDSRNTPVLDLGDHDTTDDYHNLSHHGKSEAKLAQLKSIDEWHMKLLGQLFADLKGVRETDATLFDRTMVLYGSNLGNASTHVTTNLPTLLAGGGFKHGQHLAFDTEQNYPLPNLFVSMLQRMGIDAGKFASSTGTMRGLDAV